jgi:hypothetical protein
MALLSKRAMQPSDELNEAETVDAGIGARTSKPDCAEHTASELLAYRVKHTVIHITTAVQLCEHASASLVALSELVKIRECLRREMSAHIESSTSSAFRRLRALTKLCNSSETRHSMATGTIFLAWQHRSMQK